jgi:hypothetical protein
MKALIIGAVFIFLTHISTDALAADIVINEFVPNPASNDTEWVEFYNTTNLTIDLSNYFFDDDTNFDSDAGSSTKVALYGILQGFQTCFWDLSSYLNNNGDSPTLLSLGNSSPVDTFTYSSSSAGMSYARNPDGGVWNLNQTPSKSQSKCTDLALTSTPTNSPTATSTVTPTKTPTPIKTLTPTKSPTSTKTPTPTKAQESKDEKETSILGTSSTINKEPTKEEVKVASSNTNLAGNFFILAGIVFSILCGIVILWPKIKPYLNRDAKDSNE